MFSLKSRLQSKWQFDEPPPKTAYYFTQLFEHCSLEGRVLQATDNENSWPKLLAIHGARSDYTKLNPLLYPLQAKGISSLSFNLSGHNEASSIAINHTSLRNNFIESLHFANLLGKNLNTVIGQSMGGALALKIAEIHCQRVKKIILFCPALYPESAYHCSFGEPFRQKISFPWGFLDSLSLSFLRKFEGELVLIIGQYDGLKSIDFGGVEGCAAGEVDIIDKKLGRRKVNSVIPYEVIDSIEKNLSPTQFRKIILPACDHAVSVWLRNNPIYAMSLAKQIANFLKGSLVDIEWNKTKP